MKDCYCIEYGIKTFKSIVACGAHCDSCTSDVICSVSGCHTGYFAYSEATCPGKSQLFLHLIWPN